MKNKRISKSTEHLYELVRQRGFESLYEYRTHLAKQQGFESLYKYKEHLARNRGFNSHTEYQEHLAIEKGFKSLHEYKEHLAKKQGFKSYTEYQIFLAKERQKRTLNKKLSIIINQQLEILDKNAKWLADELGITEGAVSRYREGKTIPRRSLQQRLFEILKLPYKTLDDIMKNET